MSASEQKEATEDAIKELDERKEMRNLALHNVPIAAFHDTRATQQQLKTKVRSHHDRRNFNLTHSTVLGNVHAHEF